ncbi:hypothetical protein ACWCXH_24380 [Kitasatospora sp. NPDC001660]
MTSPAASATPFTPAVQAWHAAFDEPCRLDDTARKRIPHLPTAAHDPAFACRNLDTRALLARIGINDGHPVSGGLEMSDRTS